MPILTGTAGADTITATATADTCALGEGCCYYANASMGIKIGGDVARFVCAKTGRRHRRVPGKTLRFEQP